MSTLNPYSYERDADSGLIVVLRDGYKVGETQTPTAARLMARNHNRMPLRQWDVTLTPDAGTFGRTVNTHTWGRNYREAYARVAHMIDTPEFEGWSFKVDRNPSA